MCSYAENVQLYIQCVVMGSHMKQDNDMQFSFYLHVGVYDNIK